MRFYTYITTMAYCMEAAAQSHISFVVLDRPDPLGGDVIEGPMLDRDRTSFVGYFPMPVRYAMTLGELARMFNAENKIGADLRVVAMKNWRRSETYDADRSGVDSSFAELAHAECRVSLSWHRDSAGGGRVGGAGNRFAVRDFRRALDSMVLSLLAELNARKIRGVSFAPARFAPREGLYKDQECAGVVINVRDSDALRPMLMGLEIAEALQRLYPQQFHLEKMIALLGSQSTIERLMRGDEPARIVAGWSGELASFRRMREKYLLY